MTLLIVGLMLLVCWPSAYLGDGEQEVEVLMRCYPTATCCSRPHSTDGAAPTEVSGLVAHKRGAGAKVILGA